jgi:hypothetical protein
MTIALVNKSKHQVISLATTNPISYSAAGGTTLIALFDCQNTTSTTATIADTVGNSWSTAVGFSTGSGNAHIAAFYVPSSISGANTITVTTDGSVLSNLFILEYSGISGAFDAASVIKGAFGTGVLANSVTPAASGELAIFFAATGGTSGVFSAFTGGFTQEDSQSGGPSATWGDLIAGSGAVNASATLSVSTNWSAIILLFKSLAVLSLADSSASVVTSSVTASSPCVVNDLLLSQFQLNNVSAAHSTFTPTISDTVNISTYAVPWSTYYAAGSKIYGYAWLAATTAGTPTVSVASNVAFSGGEFNYIRITNFAVTPALDPASTSASSSTNPITGSITTGGINEAVLQLMWNTAGGSIPSGPGGWSEIFNASGGGIIDPFWLENAAPGTATFSANGSTSAPWYSVTAGFASGAFGGTLNANVGTFSLTGQSATLTLSQIQQLVLLANPGAFDLLGAQSQSLLQQSFDTGVFSWTGRSASFSQSTGYTPFVVSTGIFALTGFDAALQTGNYVFSAFSGTFAISGQNATFTLIVQGNMPNLVGMDFYQALDALQNAGIYVPGGPVSTTSSLSVIWAPSTVTPGFVSAQSLAFGTEVAAGTPLVLTLSQFPFSSVIDLPPDWKQAH